MRAGFVRSSLFAATLGCVGALQSLPTAAHAQFDKDDSLFVLAADPFSPDIEQSIDVPLSRRSALSEGDFSRYYVNLRNPARIDLAFERDFQKSGKQRSLRIAGHTYFAGSREMMLEVRQIVLETDYTGRREFASVGCHLRQRAVRPSASGIAFLSFGGQCNGREVEFTLSVIQQPRSATEKACVEEGVRLSLALDKADRARASAVIERDQAKATLQKVSYALTSAVVPYLTRVVDTLKEQNSYYIALRKDAKGVLDAAKKAQP